MAEKIARSNYKITARRWDIPELIIKIMRNINEREAREEFEKAKADRNYSWGYLRLVQFEERIIDNRNPNNLHKPSD